jgi:hypothetical protein
MSVGLSAIVLQRRFWRRVEPFPHVVARDVFRPELVAALEGAFASFVGRGLSASRDPERFSRSVPGYGAYVFHLGPGTEGPLSLFLSRGWHDMLARLFGVDATLDVDVALHHHEPRSPTGWVHNDLNPGFFVDQPRPDGVNASDALACDYQSGALLERRSGLGAPREVVRAVALLYFLGNDRWSPGDGGETGLFTEQWSDVRTPAARVPPHNNSLVAFECTPRSYHAFLSNVRSPRSCVVMWLHRKKSEVVERWGERSIQRWPGT